MKKTNNKGFSLVELIIVIAIMVILVAVIAPQYTKFVQKSRVSADVNTAADMATAIDVAIAEGKSPFTGSGISGNQGDSISNVGNLTAFPLSKLDNDASRTRTTDKTWKITGDNTDGVSKIEVWNNKKTGGAGYEVVYPSTATD